MTILKYPLSFKPRQTLMLPKGARLLCVQMQHESPMLWAEMQHESPMLWAVVDQHETAKDAVTLLTVGTGHIMSESDVSSRYIGTYQTSGVDNVFHVFEVV
jgi:voltage-gated potassium channel Kch